MRGHEDVADCKGLEFKTDIRRLLGGLHEASMRDIIRVIRLRVEKKLR